MADNESQSSEQSIQLKDPFVAGVLAWLVPGLGHFYQGRNAKGALFTICILGTFLYGLYLGGSKEVGWGRAVYYSFRSNDWRLPWLCQIGVGLPTVPMTLLQANLQGPALRWLHGAAPFARSRSSEERSRSLEERPFPSPAAPGQMNLAWINRLLPHYYELGTVYTMIAGLLNILAVYDACCGPVPAEPAKKDDERPKGKRGRPDEDNGEENS